MGRTGVWLVGARGSVAVTAVLGVLAVTHRLADHTGCVTELPDLASDALPALNELVIGGHDVVTTPLLKRAERLAEAGVVPAHLPGALAAELAAVDRVVRPGVVADGRPQWSSVEAVAADLRAFRAAHGLDRVVVVNVSSTEPPVEPRPEHQTWAALRDAMARQLDVVPTSSVYAAASLIAGCPFVDFTPSTGCRLPALDELARQEGIPYAGSDGKTGETLLKSALAPMFASRALRVRSWSGTNLLGGGDGETLADPQAQRSKAASKARVVEEVLGHPVDGPLHIDYVPDLGDWKTAWDHVSFEGFLGTRMTLQLTWQGCDSALAAPLVLDLARLAAAAHAAGVSGPVPELGFFFKDPVASREHRLAAQYDALVAWVRALPALPASGPTHP